MVDRAYALYRAGAAVTRTLPGPLIAAMTDLLSRNAPRFSDSKRHLVERNLRRILGNDLDLNRPMTAPTFRIREMQIGGM